MTCATNDGWDPVATVAVATEAVTSADGLGGDGGQSTKGRAQAVG